MPFVGKTDAFCIEQARFDFKSDVLVERSDPRKYGFHMALLLHNVLANNFNRQSQCPFPHDDRSSKRCVRPSGR